MKMLSLLALAAHAQVMTEGALKPAQSITELRQQPEKALQDLRTPGLSVAIVHLRRGVHWFSTAVISALLIAAVYLAYWGIVGIRTWA